MNSYICLLSLRNFISRPVVRNFRMSVNSILKNPSFIQHYPLNTQPFAVNKIQLLRPVALNRPYTVQQKNLSKNQLHTNVWLAERGASILLLLCAPAMFVMNSEYAECSFIVLTALHVHWGVEAILVDYVRPAVFGNTIPKYAELLAGIISTTLLAVLLWISLNGGGFVKTMKQLWHLDMNIEKDTEE